MDRRVRLFCRQNKNVDDVLAARINKYRNVSARERIQPSPNQRESFIAKILHGRRIIQLSGEPWLYGVLIRLSNIGQVARLQ